MYMYMCMYMYMYLRVRRERGPDTDSGVRRLDGILPEREPPNAEGDKPCPPEKQPPGR